MRRSRFGIVAGCDFHRIEQVEMDAERGGRGENSLRPRRDELVPEILADGDSEKLEADGKGGAIIGIGVADKS